VPTLWRPCLRTIYKTFVTMAYREILADRIREKLMNVPNVVEKRMMGGLTFMVNDKMCVGVLQDEMMCRINPKLYSTALEKTGCREMDFTGKSMKGFILVEETGMRTETNFNYWIQLALDYNKLAKSSKRKKSD
jgi:TfoX/Sxy family transcriptional regulator of competence genes